MKQKIDLKQLERLIDEIGADVITIIELLTRQLIVEKFAELKLNLYHQGFIEK